MSVSLMIFMTVLGLAREATAQTATGAWNVYTNAAYRYEIRYPDEFEVRATGREGQRDGAAIRIARKEYAAPTPVLDVYVAGLATSTKALPVDAPTNMDVVLSDTV